jgi:hypothetical protein
MNRETQEEQARRVLGYQPVDGLDEPTRSQECAAPTMGIEEHILLERDYAHASTFENYCVADQCLIAMLDSPQHTVRAWARAKRKAIRSHVRHEKREALWAERGVWAWIWSHVVGVK